MAITIREARRTYKDRLPTRDQNVWHNYNQQVESTIEFEQRLAEFEAEFFDILSRYDLDEIFPILAANIIHKYEFRTALRMIMNMIIKQLENKVPNIRSRIEIEFKYFLEFEPNEYNYERRNRALKALEQYRIEKKEEDRVNSAKRKGFR